MLRAFRKPEVNSRGKSSIALNLACLLITVALGVWPVLYWVHWMWRQSHGYLTSFSVFSPRETLSWYWFTLLPWSGIIIFSIWACVLVAAAFKKSSRRMTEATTSLIIGWLIVYGCFVYFNSNVRWYEQRRAEVPEKLV
jgi:hypothetical protein